MVFFAKNRKMALKHLKKLRNTDKGYTNTDVRLSNNQIYHSHNWKTWRIIKKRGR